jgi:hypothetical protein
MNFNFQNIKEKIIKNWQVIVAVFLWFCVWGTYNTDIFRILWPGFPNGIFDLIHEARSFCMGRIGCEGG